MQLQRLQSSATPNLGRHERSCRVCSHPRKTEIEQDFVGWKSPAKIAREYGLGDRATVYRHAHALNLFPRRARNVRAALEKIIERVDDVEVNAGAVIQAIATLARINSQGCVVERSEQINLHDLFDQMSREELELYAKDGTVPAWFNLALVATPLRSSGVDGNG